MKNHFGILYGMWIAKFNGSKMGTLPHIPISSKPSISDVTTSKLRDLQWKLINFHEDSAFLV